MGTSSDAYFAWGLDLDEEIPEGLRALFAKHDLEGTYFDDLAYAILGVEDAGWPEKRAALETFPIDLITHCSYDYPMYFLAVRGTVKRASRGYPKKISIDELKLTNEQTIAFNRFCVDIGVDPADAGWSVFSVMG